jgi:hypothetical protein
MRRWRRGRKEVRQEESERGRRSVEEGGRTGGKEGKRTERGKEVENLRMGVLLKLQS